MSRMPATSVSLLRDIADDPRCARWRDFYREYEPPMREFLAARYPLIDADDAVQETMLALARTLDGYRYAPESRGRFRNYLLGILRHKAEDQLRRRRRETEKMRGYRAEPAPPAAAPDVDEAREAALELALAQLLGDERLDRRHREIFAAVAVQSEAPRRVAGRFGVSRANVDQIRSRMVRRLAALANRLLKELEP